MTLPMMAALSAGVLSPRAKMLSLTFPLASSRNRLPFSAPVKSTEI
jgi:hypothetical protein